jgi:hypothetical protein
MGSFTQYSTKIQIIRYLLGIKHYDSNDLKLKKV